MKSEQDAADAAVSPALLFWSRLIQAAAAVVIILSLTLLLTPRLGEAIFNLVYFHQPTIPVEVPNLAMGYIWFANGIIGAVMAGWMICIILSARGAVRGRSGARLEDHCHATGQLVSHRYGVFNRPWRLGQCVARDRSALFAPALQSRALVSRSGWRKQKPALVRVSGRFFGLSAPFAFR